MKKNNQGAYKEVEEYFKDCLEIDFYENIKLLRKLCYNIIKMDTRYDKLNKNGNLVKPRVKRKMNRYVNYPEEFEKLLNVVIPQIYNK